MVRQKSQNLSGPKQQKFISYTKFILGRCSFSLIKILSSCDSAISTKASTFTTQEDKKTKNYAVKQGFSLHQPGCVTCRFCSHFFGQNQSCGPREHRLPFTQERGEMKQGWVNLWHFFYHRGQKQRRIKNNLSIWKLRIPLDIMLF